MNLTDKLEFFDCNCMIGRTGVLNREVIHTSEQFLQEMDYAGIKSAIVWHAMSRDCDAVKGNEILLDEIGVSKRLYPMFTLVPEHTDEFGSIGNVLAEMKKYGVRAVRMFPLKHGFSISDWNSKNILNALEENKIPLFINIDQVEWTGVNDLLSHHKKLNVVVTTTRYNTDRFVYPLFEKYENLYFETCWYAINMGIENIVKRFGPKRLLFGTNMPEFSPGISLAHVIYSDLSFEEKKLIAGDNLRGLLCLNQES